MKNAEIERSLRDCQSLFKEKEIKPKIQDLLTKAILIEICASFNREVKSLLQKKLSTISDISIRDFANSCVENELRRQNPKYKRIQELVGRFGDSYKTKLEEELKRLEEVERHEIVISAYDSLFSSRNKAAHSQNIEVTLNEVKNYYESAHRVLDCLQSTLKLC